MDKGTENLRKLLSPYGEVARVAQAIGVGRKTVERWRDGAKPSSKNLDKLCKYYGKSREWYLTGEEATEPTPKSAMNMDAEVWIPIVGKVWATPFRLATPSRAHKHIRARPGENDCFVLEVEGDSMEPFVFPGDLVICRPHSIELSPHTDMEEGDAYVPYDRMAPYNNRDAIVEHDGDTMLKRLEVERRKGPFYDLYMVSVNKTYQKVKVKFGDDWKMKAVVLRTEKPPIAE